MDTPASGSSWTGTTPPAFLTRSNSSRTNGNRTETDNNNNSSSCANQERRPQKVSLEISELAKTIGNEFRGEFIVLPHHLVTFDNDDPVDLDRAGAVHADDEVSSNSEDCVYAYRGDHEEGEIGDADEETDYLEMDFDPEPTSEQEENCRIGAGGSVNEEFPRVDPSSLMQTKALNDWRERNEPEAGCSTINTTDDEKPTNEILGGASVEDLQDESKVDDVLCNDYYDHELNDLSSEEEDVVDSLYIAVAIDSEDAEVVETESDAPIIKITGTKPKVKQIDCTAPVPNPHPTIPNVPIPSNTNDNLQQSPKDVSCLECSEMELLTATSQSVGSVCKKHCKKLRNNEPEEVVDVTPEIPGIAVARDAKQIQICPNILNEENIYSSFLLLGIELHRERLHEQVEVNRLSLERTKTIADYLVKFTKGNCDPRRFVKVIEKCCPEDVFSELDFNLQSVSPEFNVLHVAASEILSRWSSEEGLRELGKVANKRFHNANVLGRVANLLRIRGGGVSRCREIDKVAPPALLVPTYHRPGILLISRRNHQTNATLLQYKKHPA